MGFIKRHYCWIIVTVILLELAVYSGILNNISSLHLIPVTTEQGMSRGSFSLAMSVRSLTGFFSTLLSGILFRKFGHRKLATVFLLIAGGAFVLLGWSQNVMMLAVACGVIGLSEGFCSTAAASRMVNTWFRSHQGLILGLVTASTGLGGSLFSVVLSDVIQVHSWRQSYWLSGILMASAAVMIFLLSRNRPGDIGSRPFGETKPHGKKARKENRDHWFGYEPEDVTKKATFKIMIAVVFFSCVCSYIPFAVVVPHLQDCGMSASDAASYQSILLLALAAAKFICGILSDIIGARSTNLLCMLCTVAALVLLALINGPTMALIAMIVFSVALVMTTITVPLLSSSLFGYHCQSNIIGIFMALVPAASVVTNPIVNLIYDRIGSYKPIFLGGAILAAVTTALMILLFILAARDRKKYESTHSNMPALEDII